MTDNLRFVVERWTADGGKPLDLLAACSSVQFAEAVFNVAIQSRTKEHCTISQGRQTASRISDRVKRKNPPYSDPAGIS